MAIHSPLGDPPNQIFLDHLLLIEKAAGHAGRGIHLQPQEMEDFVSCVKIKFIENDYEVIRKYRGESKIGTYLITCVSNFFKDYLNHIWGKWRPSAKAKELGRIAIDLERLLVRDGLTLHEACEILITNHHVAITRQDLENLATQLPSRSQRQTEGEEILSDIEAPGEQPVEQLLEKEREEKRRKDLQALARARTKLSSEDCVILGMRYDEGLPIVAIARRLQLEQKGLYRRIERILKRLRELMKEDPGGDEP